MYNNYYEIGMLSDIGNKREINQDRIGCMYNDNAAIIAVADGMGGMNKGEEASAMAIDGIIDWWDNAGEFLIGIPMEEAEEQLLDAIYSINDDIVEHCRNNDIRSGTTLTAALMIKNICIYAYSGDTRLYLLREGKAQQLTCDENLFAYLECSGSEDNPPKNKSVLVSYIGKGANLALNFNTVKIQPKDIIVICTDGLYNYFDFSEKENIEVLIENDPQEATKIIVNLVKKQKASDNLSLIIAKFK